MKRQLPQDLSLEGDGEAMLQFNDAPSNRSAEEFQHKLAAEIVAAGGVDAWRVIQQAQKQAA
ncbi:MAG: hypothetical protein Q8J80_12610 [Gallionella sp.]|nr:hypothetical protein [Gallionella sp.]